METVDTYILQCIIFYFYLWRPYKRMSLTNSKADPQQFNQIRMRKYFMRIRSSWKWSENLYTDRPWARGEPPSLPCEPSQLPAFT